MSEQIEAGNASADDMLIRTLRTCGFFVRQIGLLEGQRPQVMGSIDNATAFFKLAVTGADASLAMAFSPYLKESETPLERLQREIKDSETLAAMLGEARAKVITASSDVSTDRIEVAVPTSPQIDNAATERRPNFVQIKSSADFIRPDLGDRRFWPIELDSPPAASAVREPLSDRDQNKPAEQQGLFRKFNVSRVDGSDVHGGKHYGCRYYVLDLTHDQHAPAAMRAYAAACRATHPKLAADIEAEFGSAAAADAGRLTDREIMEEWDRHYLPGQEEGTPFLSIVVNFARHWMPLPASKDPAKREGDVA